LGADATSSYWRSKSPGIYGFGLGGVGGSAHDLRAQLFQRDLDLPRIVIGQEGLLRK